jgi:Nucleolar pre-ribosomal-associated protein 1
LDQYRWQDVADSPDAQSKYPWDWLVNGLQLRRIRATLRFFPLDDAVQPLPIADIEASCRTIAVAEVGGSDSVEICSESSNLEVEEAVATRVSERIHSIVTNDSLYSPAYILPLVLAALEACVEDAIAVSQTDVAGESISGKESKTNPVAGHELLAKTAQRLCEKGALSLALGSLCSRCCSLRQIAVAVLGLLARAIDCEEARDISSWRERPQLAMLLRSVHRALAIRRATMLVESQCDESKEKAAWVVPKLPGFSAIFLAMSALVLSRPGDSAYSPLNKCFLSIDSDHGAFRDLNRLPAFIMLLCSTALEPPGQARLERLFALSLFRDGLLDDFCFKSALSCHAPALLMSTFFNFRSRLTGSVKEVEEECLLLLEAIARIFRCGGPHATHVMTDRMGSISWIRGVLESRDLKQLVPTRSCRVALLNLVATAVHQAVSDFRRHGDGRKGTSLLFEVTVLAQPTLKLGVIALEDGVSHDEEGAQKAALSLSSAAGVAALKSLQSALLFLKGKCATMEIEDVRSDGVFISTMLEFLSKARHASTAQLHVILEALVIFPFNLRASVKEATQLCVIMLDSVCSGASNESFVFTKMLLMRISLILKRVVLPVGRDALMLASQMASEYPTMKSESEATEQGNNEPTEEAIDVTTTSVGDELVRKLLKSQKTCCQWPECRALWIECLHQVMGQTVDSVLTLDFELAGEEEGATNTIRVLRHWMTTQHQSQAA